MFGASEMLVIGVLALILIGSKQLPEVARTLGKFIAELKRTANGFTAEFKNEMDREAAKNKPAEKVETPRVGDKFVLRYEDGTPMRPEDQLAESAAPVEGIPSNPDAKKDEPT
jgi:sec-independent protein translocase protein TatB